MFGEQNPVPNENRSIQERDRIHGPEILSFTGVQCGGGFEAKARIPNEHDGEALEGSGRVSKVFQLLAGEEDKAQILGAKGAECGL